MSLLFSSVPAWLLALQVGGFQAPAPLPYSSHAEHADCRRPILRHAQGLQAFEVEGGKSPLAYNASLLWRYYARPPWHYAISSGAALYQGAGRRYYAFFFKPACLYTLLSNYKNLFLSLEAAPLPLYEVYQPATCKGGYDQWNLAIVLGIVLEYFFSSHLSLVVGAEGRGYVRTRPYGLLGYQLSLGLSCHY